MVRHPFRWLSVLIACTMCFTACTPLGPKIDESVSDNHYYSLFRTSVIFGWMGNCFELGCFEIEEADVDTFRPLNYMYAVDEHRVYYQQNVILDETPDGFRLAGGPYAVGSKGAYWDGETFPVQDEESFQAVEFRLDERKLHYGVDSSGVYCRNRKISDHPDGFHALERPTYFADSGDVYVMRGGTCQALGADPDGFQFLKKADGAYSVYAKDSSSVYVLRFDYRAIEGADSATFEVLCSGVGPPHYARDKNRVYDFGEIVDGIDPNTFSIDQNCG